MTPDTNRSTVVLSIDVETLATTPDAHVVQVGWCAGNWLTKEILVQPQTRWMTDEPAGRVDPETARWWLTQDPSVLRRVFLSDASLRTTAHMLRHELATTVDTYGCDVWASPAMFDLPILNSLFTRAGLARAWEYNTERDMMTLYKLIDPTGSLQPPKNEMQHDAGFDALWQLQYLFALMDRLHDNFQGVPV
jgi:3' exoribonuclease, RNase T-like